MLLTSCHLTSFLRYKKNDEFVNFLRQIVVTCARKRCQRLVIWRIFFKVFATLGILQLFMIFFVWTLFTSIWCDMWSETMITSCHLTKIWTKKQLKFFVKFWTTSNRRNPDMCDFTILRICNLFVSNWWVIDKKKMLVKSCHFTNIFYEVFRNISNLNWKPKLWIFEVCSFPVKSVKLKCQLRILKIFFRKFL